MKKIIKSSSFPSNTLRDKVLTTNGKVLDNWCIKLKTTENLETGSYIADGTYLLEAQDYLEKEKILKVRLDYGDEIFRISKVTIGTKYIDIVARQITIAESLTLYLADVRPMNTNGQGSLSWLLANAIGIKEITLTSNITKINTAYYQDMSLYKALHDSDQSFQNRWGGEILRRGYNITINATTGIDRGVSIREGKNLKGFTGTSNIDNLTTRARGKGFDGIVGSWINSPIAYARTYTNTIDYQDVKVVSSSESEGYATLALAQAELNRRVILEFSENDIDKMKAIYNIDFVQLSKTEEYKNYIVAETIYIGDTIRVYIPKIKTDIKVRAIERIYNVLAQKIEDLKLSNVVQAQAMSLNNILKDIKNQYLNTNNNSMASYIDSVIKSGMKDSYVVMRDNEFLAMDSKDINTAINITRINKNGIAFSTTGYYGTYTYGFTLDGVINASMIRSGILSTILLESADGLNYFNLDTGAIHFDKGIIEGPNMKLDLNNGFLKATHSDGSYTKLDALGLVHHSGTTDKDYHHLMYTGEVVIGSGSHSTEVTITCPDEFKGKDFSVNTSVQNTGNTSATALANLWCQATSKNKANGTFNVLAYARLIDDTYVNIQFSYTLIA